MKKIILIYAAVLACFAAKAQDAVVGDVRIYDTSIERVGDDVRVSMSIDLSSVSLGTRNALILTPVLQSAGQSVSLPPVEILSRNQFIYKQRNGGTGVPGAYRHKNGTSQVIPYSATVAYKPWMDGSVLFMEDSRRTCCKTFVGEVSEIAESGLVAPVFNPRYAFVKPTLDPEHNVKIRSIQGSAYVAFPVNSWEIKESYLDNPVELAKIGGTIDSVKRDKDVTITDIVLKGFASPESSWSHNARLAENRTKALRDYLLIRYNIDTKLISTEYEAEDWAGLRKFVENSSLLHRDEIIEIIDSKRDPDNKENLIKSRYPSDYQFLYKECYPFLRHTDYKIGYRIKSYTETAELRTVFREHPENLSLEELYALALSYETGSDAFNEVFETAVKYYPEDQVANLNAANVALSSGNYDKAREYLRNAGNSPEAVNARAILAFYSGDMAGASRLLAEASSRGLAEAAANAESLSRF